MVPLSTNSMRSALTRQAACSASLKAVLPVLCPELRYKDLIIQNGEETMLTWYKFQAGEIPIEEQENVRQAMKDYCELDTYGMIAIMEKLNQIIRRNNGY